MEEKKANTEGTENTTGKQDDKSTMHDKAGDFARETKERAENFAEKTLEGIEKLVGDVTDAFKKKGASAEAEEEAATDPKDIEIAELKKELEELRDKYVRLYADFDNQRKRNAKERIELIQTAGKEIITSMLPVVDDFERAQKALANSTDVNAVKEGLNLIQQKLTNTLTSKGLKPMESIGKDFDVEVHEAITEIPATPEQAGKVIDEVEKGYYLNDKLIRFAKVIVGKKS